MNSELIRISGKYDMLLCVILAAVAITVALVADAAAGQAGVLACASAVCGLASLLAYLVLIQARLQAQISGADPGARTETACLFLQGSAIIATITGLSLYIASV
jgi:hypothetical protein